jgi:hypothetical protein
MQLLPMWPAYKNLLMALLVVDSGVSSSDANFRIAKPWIKLKILCQRCRRTHGVLFLEIVN